MLPLPTKSPPFDDEGDVDVGDELTSRLDGGDDEDDDEEEF